MKVSYKKNEWLAVYVDECGDRQIMPFGTYEEADRFLRTCLVRIGVMCTRWYDRYIEKVVED